MVSLAHNHTVDLPGSMAGKKVVFTSSTLDLTKPASGDNTSLNLLNHAGDTLLHLSFRRFGDSIHLSSGKVDGGWDDGEVCPGLARAFGPHTEAATVVVQDTDDAFVVSINGNYLATYPKKYPGGARQARYIINSGQDSIFSNPVTVSIHP